MSPIPEPTSPSLKKTSPKLKMLGPLCNQALQNSVLQYTEIKI